MLKNDGFDKFQKDLKKMQKAAEDMEGSQSVPFSELFPDSFLRKHTKFSSYEEFSNQEILTKYPSLEAIPDDEMDEFVSLNTNFPNWEEMLGTATTAYVSRKLGF